MEITGRGEEAEDMMAFTLGVFEVGDGCEIGEGELFEETFFGW